jgi:hypothetical protein
MTKATSDTLKALRECVFVQSHGRGAGANDAVGPTVYATLGSGTECTREAGFDRSVKQDELAAGRAIRECENGSPPPEFRASRNVRQATPPGPWLRWLGVATSLVDVAHRQPTG